ncbi:MAG: carboxypeptidase regulatory-like domain-containing protein [Terriglobales bacterium]
MLMMRRLDFAQNIWIGLLCCALLIPAPLVPRAEVSVTTPVVIIRVTDPTGVGVAHARIRLVPSPENAPAKMDTDDKGQLSINLKTGPYALFVTAAGFKKATQHIDIDIDIDIPERKAGVGQVVQVVLRIGDVSSPTPIYPTGTVFESHLLLTADPYHAPVTLTPVEFRAPPHTNITVHNSHANATETYSGVPLATLLAKVNAPIGNEFHEEALTSYLLASGSDGYSVLLSLAEVDPTFHEGQVLVADTRDGQPLGKSGPFELIVSDDKRPARWVHNLVSITLQQPH